MCPSPVRVLGSRLGIAFLSAHGTRAADALGCQCSSAGRSLLIHRLLHVYSEGSDSKKGLRILREESHASVSKVYTAVEL